MEQELERQKIERQISHELKVGLDLEEKSENLTHSDIDCIIASQKTEEINLIKQNSASRKEERDKYEKEHGIANKN